MARAGRPPKGAQGPRRTVRRTTRLTEEEATRLDRKAADVGMTVSDYLRWRVFPETTVVYWDEPGNPDDGPRMASVKCRTCLGYGHLDDEGEPSVDRRNRKCLDCGGAGTKTFELAPVVLP